MWGAELGQDETHGSGQIELTFNIIHFKDGDLNMKVII